MTTTQYIILTALQSLISVVLFLAYRGASRVAEEAEVERREAFLRAADAETARSKAVYEKHHSEMVALSRTTSREEVARAVETLAAALTPRAGAAEACAKADKRPAPRPRRR